MIKKEFKSNLIGKRVNIKDNADSWARGASGTIEYYDGDHYHIAIYDDDKVQLIFDRNEFVVPKNQGYPKGYFGALSQDEIDKIIKKREAGRNR